VVRGGEIGADGQDSRSGAGHDDEGGGEPRAEPVAQPDRPHRDLTAPFYGRRLRRSPCNRTVTGERGAFSEAGGSAILRRRGPRGGAWAARSSSSMTTRRCRRRRRSSSNGRGSAPPPPATVRRRSSSSPPDPSSS